jgi:formyl-CoA transferase
MDTEHKPLGRFRVLDLTRALSGPAAVRQLADWGAVTVKIEVPTDDPNPPDEMSPRNGSYFQNVHRNKTSMTLNLRDERGRQIFYRLVERVDVVVENYRPAVKKRLGIDYETLKAINARLIYGSLSGFGEDGPYSDRPAFDQIIQGMGGLMSVTGFPGGLPVRAGLAISDLSAGLYLACGILTALLEREVTGEGCWVRTSLLEGMIAMMDFQAARWLTEGEIPRQVGNDHPTNFPMSAYETADRPINVAPIEQAMWQKFCGVIERPDLADNPDYQSEQLRVRNKEPLRSEITDTMRKRESAYWIDRMNTAGVPCGPIYNMDEVFEDPQVKHLRMSEKVAHPVVSAIGMLRQPVRLRDEPQKIFYPVPPRGAQTRQVLLEAGFSEQEIESFAADGVI